MSSRDTEEMLTEDIFRSALDDDNGVSEKTYNAMMEFASHCGFRHAKYLLEQADATDGRFYLSSDCDACDGEGTTGGTPDGGASPCDVCHGRGKK